MADDIDIVRERLRQQRARDRGVVAPGGTLNGTPEDRLAMTWKPGDRVIDLVTGEEAIVEGSYRETVHVPTANKPGS